MSEIKPNYDTHRTNLRDVIPLNGPYSIQIEPTKACDHRCWFCLHATRGAEEDLFQKSGFRATHMDMDLYRKLVHDLMEFPEPPRAIQMSGLGEPALNPRFGEMLRILRGAGYKGRIFIYTNGAHLTPAVVDELVRSGISEFRVSVNGLTSEQYKQVTGFDMDIGTYMANIRYLYEHKENAIVRVKIIDDFLNGEADKQKFFDMFGNISDSMWVENIVQYTPQLGDVGGAVAGNRRNVHNEPLPNKKVCAAMFYSLSIDVEGNVIFCANLGIPGKYGIGNVREDSLLKLWNGEKRLKCLRTNLSHGSDAIPICVGCDAKNCIIAKEEYLDDCAEELLRKLPVHATLRRNCDYESI